MTPELEQYLLTSDSKSLKVLLHLLDIRDHEGAVVGTLDKIAADCSVTKVTVNKVFQRLYKESYLEKTGNGKYKVINV